MKIFKRVKGHYIAKLILYIPFMCLFLIQVDLAIKSDLNNITLLYGDWFQILVSKWGYNFTVFIQNTSTFVHWLYIILAPALLIFILDIIAGVGRSRADERHERKQKIKYNKAAKKLKEMARDKYIPMFIDELEIGDMIRTDTDGNYPIESIDLEGGSIKLENGISYYPNKNETFNYIYE